MIKAEDFKWLDRVYHLFHLGSYMCLSGALTDCFLPFTLHYFELHSDHTSRKIVRKNDAYMYMSKSHRATIQKCLDESFKQSKSVRISKVQTRLKGNFRSLFLKQAHFHTFWQGKRDNEYRDHTYFLMH